MMTKIIPNIAVHISLSTKIKHIFYL